MRITHIVSIGVMFGLLATSGLAQDKSNPGEEGHTGAQAAADAIRAQAGADGAFLTAKNIKSTYNPQDLSTLMQYPTEGIVVVKLTGAEIRAAFEHAASLYPQANTSFLQISGFTVDISAGAPSEKRVVGVSTDAGPLNDTKTYQIAMPALLGRGGMGYFTIWDKSKIT